MKGLLLIALTAFAAHGQTGMRDPYFRRYPFDTWVKEGVAAQLKWQVKTPAAFLSPYQRLVQRIEAQLEPTEVERRRGHGEIVFLLEISDPTGRKWRTHEVADLRQIPADLKAKGIVFAQDLFILPGTYTVSLIVCDAETKEHSLFRRAIRVAPLRTDPLPDSWHDLPPIEFARIYAQPDAWFQPFVRGKLALPAASKRPVHIDVVMNMTPSQRAQGSLRSFRRNMSVLIPGLRVLAGISAADGALDVAVLDLARRKKWEQKNVRGLDWRHFREPFADTNPGIIDAQSLAGKAAMTQFLWDELLDRLKPQESTTEAPLRVVIVLSSPVFLERQIKVEPATYPKDANRRVYYLQYRPITQRTFVVAGTGEAVPAAVSLPSDDLEHTLKLLDARIFSIINAEQFRKALAYILADIARM